MTPFKTFEERTADTDRQRAQAKEEQEFAQELADAWRWFTADRRGRKLAWFILARCGAFNISFTGSAPMTDFNEGRRDVGNYLLNNMLGHDPAAFVKMLAEHDDDRRNRRS